MPAPRTRRLLATLPVDPDAPGGAGGAGSWEALQRADASWAAMRGLAEPPPAGEFVRRLRGSRLPSGPPTFDVAVCGGTLGVVYAAALAATGLSVVVVERGRLAGRAQEWNVSASELQELVGAGVLTAFDAEACVTSRFGADGNRLGLFGHPGSTVAVRDVLNLGVSPAAVVAAARRALEAAGGSVAERTAVAGLSVHDDGVALDGTGITAQLVVDALGHGSPLVRQVRGSDRRPDGVCLVVGCCARGYDPAANAEGDVLVTTGNLEADGDLLRQTFWEAFPAGSGPADRTVYQFTYVDADPGRGSLTAMMARKNSAAPFTVPSLALALFSRHFCVCVCVCFF